MTPSPSPKSALATALFANLTTLSYSEAPDTLTAKTRAEAAAAIAALADLGYRVVPTGDVERLRAVEVAARGHGICTCAGLGGDGEGPRPLGGGRFYHYEGCDNDDALRAALGDPR